MSEVRHDWTKEEIVDLYNKPLLELVYEAATVHRQYHNPNEVQVSTLLSIKTGGCIIIPLFSDVQFSMTIEIVVVIVGL